MTGTDKKEYWFQAIKVPQFDDKGNIIGLVGIARDITGRKRAEEALQKAREELERRIEKPTAELSESVALLKREIDERRRAEEALRVSEEKYRTVLEASPDPIVVYDIEGLGIYINPAFTKVFGWTPKELLAKKLDYVPEENWPETQMMISKVLAGESFSGVESRRYSKEGDILDVSISATTYVNRYGIPVASIHILRDITERKRAEDALQESQKRYKELWDDAPVAYHMLDTRGIIKQVNQTEKDILGYTRDEMVGKPIFEFILPEQRKEAEARFRLKLAGENVPKKHDRIYVKKDGSKMYVSIDDALEYDSDGKLLGVRTTMVDVSQEMRAQEALRKARAELEKRVEERTSGLVKANEQLKREIADRKRAEEEQRESEKRLYREQKRMEMLKFANDLALKLMHELRNPLVAVGGFAARISHGDYPKDKLKEYTGLIFEESKRLDNVLEEVVAHLKTASEQV